VPHYYLRGFSDYIFDEQHQLGLRQHSQLRIVEYS
jgi:hypothetical protein